MTSTETALTVFGALLVFGALVSGIARRAMLSLTAGFVLAGFVLGTGGGDLPPVHPRRGGVRRPGLQAEGRLRVGARRRRARGHPVPRRARGRGRAPAHGVAPAA